MANMPGNTLYGVFFDLKFFFNKKLFLKIKNTFHF